MQCASKYEDIQLDIHVGELAEGAQRAKNNETSYDIILSRGGTAETIAQSVNLPVVWMKPTIFDMLRVFRLVQNYTGKYAIVGFRDITQNAELLFEIIQLRADVFTITKASQVEECIRDLKKKGYSMVIGDVIAVDTAKRLNLNGILITSGVESVETAINEALRIHRQAQKETYVMQLQRLALSQLEEKVLVISNHAVLYSTITPQQELPSEIMSRIERLVPQVLEKNALTFKRLIDGVDYRVRAVAARFREQDAAMFFVKIVSDIPASTCGIYSYYNRSDENKEDLIDNIGCMNDVFACARRFAKVSSPVLVIREAGINDLRVVRSIHSHSVWAESPILIVDMDLVQKKTLSFLLNDENSPFNDNGQFILLRNIHQLDEDAAKKFRYYSSTTNLQRRNRMIYVLPPNHTEKWSDFFSESGCLRMTIPPLRQRSEDLVSLATLCLNSYRYQSAPHATGFEPEAIKLLETYEWPRNVEQLRRVIFRAALLSDGICISGEDIRASLEEEAYEAVNQSVGVDAFCHGSLADITARVIGVVLAQENMNRSRTATRLGISRSTLWRLINQDGQNVAQNYVEG